MKILFIMTRNPGNSYDGRAFTLTSYNKILEESCDVKKIYYSDDGKSELKVPGIMHKFFNTLFFSILRRKPLQISAMFSLKNKKTVYKIYKDFNPDLIIVDMCRLAPLVINKKIKCKKILDMDDVLSNRYYESYCNSSKNAIGQLSNTMPKFIMKIYNFLQLDKKVNKFEYKAMQRFERKCIDSFDKIVLVSPKEVREYNEKYNTNKAICWPVVVSNAMKPKLDYNNNIIAFVGNMKVSHNQETFNILVNEVLPFLPKEFILKVIGTVNDEYVKQYENNNQIIFTGCVDSISEHVRDCLCMVAPIKSGSGIKIKILESMSYGVPVITTSKGIEGLTVKDNEILISDNSKNIVEQILKISHDGQMRNEIADLGMRYTVENHSEDILRSIINKTIN